MTERWYPPGVVPEGKVDVTPTSDPTTDRHREAREALRTHPCEGGVGAHSEIGCGWDRVHRPHECEHTDATLASPADSLDEAWEAAERALPEGWDMGITKLATGERTAWAGYTPADDDERESWRMRDFEDDTNAAALRALTAALSEEPR